MHPDELSIPRADRRSVLLITLDSCRYDTFVRARVPNLRGIGAVHRAMAPGTFTLPSHAAILRGFTPGDAQSTLPYINPRVGKIFRMRGTMADPAGRSDYFILGGADIVEGFAQLGYATIGAAAMAWFNEQVPTGRALSASFDRFFHTGGPWGLDQQLEFIAEQLRSVTSPAFCFLNVGETHIPYWHEGASWSASDNPCKVFAVESNDAAECARRQLACLEFVDGRLAPLLESFAEATVVVCSDHGDAWGEDGVWSHGMHHEKVLEVPLLFRLADLAVEERTAAETGVPRRGSYARVAPLTN